MKNEIVLGGIISLIGSVVGYILSESYKFGICVQNDLSCSWLFERIGDALLFGFTALLIVFLILFFVPSTFKTWKKFAIWFIPAAIILFIIYNPSERSFINISPSAREMFLFVSGLYIVSSLIIIAISLYKSKKQKLK